MYIHFNYPLNNEIYRIHTHFIDKLSLSLNGRQEAKLRNYNYEEFECFNYFGYKWVLNLKTMFYD